MLDTQSGENNVTRTSIEHVLAFGDTRSSFSIGCCRLEGSTLVRGVFAWLAIDVPHAVCQCRDCRGANSVDEPLHA